MVQPSTVEPYLTFPHDGPENHRRDGGSRHGRHPHCTLTRGRLRPGGSTITVATVSVSVSFRISALRIIFIRIHIVIVVVPSTAAAAAAAAAGSGSRRGRC